VSCFSSADESAHYGFSVCMLLEQYRQQLGWEDGGVVELGTGDASAIADVVHALPGLRVRSYDISATSVDKARANIAARGVADRYTVELGDFFAWAGTPAGREVSTVIANPPYIPAPDGDILMPELWGGWYGNDPILNSLRSAYQSLHAAINCFPPPPPKVKCLKDS